MTASGTLILVATPIGNLGDFSPRAAEVLAAADVIACEDTRVTRKLLRLTGTATTGKLVPYHDHNGAEMRPRIIAMLEQGMRVALVSDAGTPLISDPGYKLVAACRQMGIDVQSVPGPSAVLAALAISGLPSDRFMFGGFLASGAGARRKQILELADLSATTIWFETPSRLQQSLSDMASIMGCRDAVVARELTKLHEEVLRGDLAELASHIADLPRLKGELVVLVAGRSTSDAEFDDGQVEAMLRAELEGQRLRDAVKNVVTTTGLPRNRIYRLALEITNGETGRDG